MLVRYHGRRMTRAAALFAGLALICLLKILHPELGKHLPSLLAWAWKLSKSFCGSGGAGSFALMTAYALCAATIARAHLSGGAALSEDANGLTVRSPFATRTIAWRDYRSIAIQDPRIELPIPFLPEIQFLAVTRAGSLVERTQRIPLYLLDVTSHEAAQIDARLRRKAAEAGAAREPVEARSDFDPDAAIARYLAGRSEPEAASSATPPRRSFGRKVA